MNEPDRKFNWRHISIGLGWGLGLGIFILVFAWANGMIAQATTDYETCVTSCLSADKLTATEQTQCVQMCQDDVKCADYQPYTNKTEER